MSFLCRCCDAHEVNFVPKHLAALTNVNWKVQTTFLAGQIMEEAYNNMYRNFLFHMSSRRVVWAGAAQGLVHLCAAAASLRMLQDPALPVCSNAAQCECEACKYSACSDWTPHGVLLHKISCCTHIRVLHVTAVHCSAGTGHCG